MTATLADTSPAALTLVPFAEPRGLSRRTCSVCGQDKNLAEFSPQKAGRLGRKAACRPCCAARQAEYKARNPEKVRAKDRQYNAQRRADPEYRERERQYNAQYRQTPERQAAVRQYTLQRRALKYGAATDGHTWDDLMDAWADQDMTGCMVCGVPLDDDFHVDHNVPLIRDGAHTLDNLQPLCPEHNTAKGGGCPFRFFADQFPGLRPWLEPYFDAYDRLSDAEVQRRTDDYRARHGDDDDTEEAA